MKNENRAKNIIQINEKERKKYTKVKEGDKFLAGDLIHLLDFDYVEVGEGSLLLKQKINEHNIVLRKK